MSNVIKGYNTVEVTPFILDSDKNEISVHLNERLKMQAEGHFQADEEDGFRSGLNAVSISETQLTDEDRPIDEQTVEDAHEAALIVNEAYDEAAEIRNQARLEAEDIKAQSRIHGQQEGYQQGLRDAEAEIVRMKEELLQQQEDWKAEFEQQKEQELDSLESKFAQVLCDLLERLTGIVVKGHNDVIIYLINNAMKEIENSHSFLISLSEADFPYVEKHKKEIYGYLNPGVEIELYQDPKLEKNQCKIETNQGMVDLSLDVQVDSLIRSLMLLNA